MGRITCNPRKNSVGNSQTSGVAHAWNSSKSARADVMPLCFIIIAAGAQPNILFPDTIKAVTKVFTQADPDNLRAVG